MKSKIFSLPFLLFVFSFSHFLHGYVSSDPYLEELGHHAQYPRIHIEPLKTVPDFSGNVADSAIHRLFYFFFESRNNITDPVVIWLSGGPGCSSSFGLLAENGPFTLNEDLSLSRNEYSWNQVRIIKKIICRSRNIISDHSTYFCFQQVSNIIYVDQPVGTGFSSVSDTDVLRHDETGVSNDLYNFLQVFFKEHPQLVRNDFYITGESYAGHYIPALASRIHTGNKNNEGIPIKLKGIAIGNGLTNPEIQYGAYGDYALEMKLISQSDHESLNQVYVNCQGSIRECNIDGGLACASAYHPYDARKKCGELMCDVNSNLEKFLNQENVRKALGVGDNVFVSCNATVYVAMIEDWMINLEVKIPTLIEDGISLLVYAGEYDLMNWSGQKEFGAAKTVPFMVDGKEAGVMKNHGPLIFLKPKASLQMLRTWMQGKLANQTGAIVRH
ncbi:unnamed protein product [Brassica napus]|uniref:Carboxypeptidase n=1 Tax=Brassica napus TaxID=3708 RepID=A0A817BLV2_BRANA|nr:unnamed protein product [Brassica napus]